MKIHKTKSAYIAIEERISRPTGAYYWYPSTGEVKRHLYEKDIDSNSERIFAYFPLKMGCEELCAIRLPKPEEDRTPIEFEPELTKDGLYLFKEINGVLTITGKYVYESEFRVYTWSLLGSEDYAVHWSEGLSTVIYKDGKKVVLTGEEMQQVINSLPRTFGGSY